ncbi:hypothetical protein KJ966_10560 [bacterium]|nr:hypothetical protein [bacterium]
MRKVRIVGTPPQDWVDEAEKIKEALLAAETREKRQEILDKHEGFWRDDRIRNWLLKQFNNKCWYTEAQESVSPYHVDHFRPKGRITNADKSTEEGYWWLTFNWKNYVIAGQLINTKKKDRFPLTAGARADKNWCDSQLCGELIVLIDPTTDDTRLISFEKKEDDACEAVPAGDISDDEIKRVELTIDILGLNRLSKLNSKRGIKWNECFLRIADFKSANSSQAGPMAQVIKRKAADQLKTYISYEQEFSSVAEACIHKYAPEPLKKMVFNH